MSGQKERTEIGKILAGLAYATIINPYHPVDLEKKISEAEASLRTEIVGVLEGMKKTGLIADREMQYYLGHNKAISDAIREIGEMMK